MNFLRKLTCFILSFIICFSFFVFSVSADEIDSSYFDSTDIYEGPYDFSSTNTNDYIDIRLLRSFYQKYAIASGTISSSGSSEITNYMSKNYSQYFCNNNFDISPYSSYVDDNTFYFVNTESATVRFARVLKVFLYNLDLSNLPPNFYYVCLDYDFVDSDGEISKYCTCLFSLNDDFIYSDGYLYSIGSTNYGYELRVDYEPSSSCSDHLHTYFFNSVYNLNYKQMIFVDNSMKKYKGTYTGITFYTQSGFKFNSMYTNANIKNIDKLNGNIKTSFSYLNPTGYADDVSFIVTPDLSGNIEPQGKFDFTITNNSGSSILWCFYISAQDVATCGIDDVTYSDWIYMCNEDYTKYNFENITDSGGTAYLSDVNGSMYVHLLETGKMYSDSVSWNNTQLYNNLDYSARCLIFPSEDTQLNFTKFESEHFNNFIDSVSPSLFGEYGLLFSLCGNLSDNSYMVSNPSTSFNFDNPVYIYNSNFSLTDNTLYTRANLSGTGIANRGFVDAIAQTQNYYSYTYEGDTVYNENYTEPYLLNTSPDWDGISASDIKNLVNGTTTFFDILASVFNFFPAYAWVLISLGIVFIIAIALIKLFL